MSLSTRWSSRAEAQPPMPELSRFYGIVVRMYYNDHNPPHVHAEYQVTRSG